MSDENSSSLTMSAMGDADMGQESSFHPEERPNLTLRESDSSQTDDTLSKLPDPRDISNINNLLSVSDNEPLSSSGSNSSLASSESSDKRTMSTMGGAQKTDEDSEFSSLSMINEQDPESSGFNPENRVVVQPPRESKHEEESEVNSLSMLGDASGGSSLDSEKREFDCLDQSDAYSRTSSNSLNDPTYPSSNTTIQKDFSSNRSSQDSSNIEPLKPLDASSSNDGSLDASNDEDIAPVSAPAHVTLKSDINVIRRRVCQPEQNNMELEGFGDDKGDSDSDSDSDSDDDSKKQSAVSENSPGGAHVKIESCVPVPRGRNPEPQPEAQPRSEISQFESEHLSVEQRLLAVEEGVNNLLFTTDKLHDDFVTRSTDLENDIHDIRKTMELKDITKSFMKLCNAASEMKEEMKEKDQIINSLQEELKEKDKLLKDLLIRVTALEAGAETPKQPAPQSVPCATAAAATASTSVGTVPSNSSPFILPVCSNPLAGSSSVVQMYTYDDIMMGRLPSNVTPSQLTDDAFEKVLHMTKQEFFSKGRVQQFRIWNDFCADLSRSRR